MNRAFGNPSRWHSSLEGSQFSVALACIVSPVLWRGSLEMLLLSSVTKRFTALQVFQNVLGYSRESLCFLQTSSGFQSSQLTLFSEFGQYRHSPAL